MDPIVRREDRIQAEVQCLMCGRLIGELFGFVRRQDPGRRTSRSVAYLTTFRPAILGAADLPMSGREQFRCFHCGGLGVVEEVSMTLASETVPSEELCQVHGERMHRGVGRPPKGCACYEPRLAA